MAKFHCTAKNVDGTEFSTFAKTPQAALNKILKKMKMKPLSIDDLECDDEDEPTVWLWEDDVSLEVWEE